MITLTDAIAKKLIAEFIAQEEKRRIGPVERAELDAAIKKLATAKPPLSKGRTSRSSSGDGSNGK